MTTLAQPGWYEKPCMTVKISGHNYKLISHSFGPEQQKVQ